MYILTSHRYPDTAPCADPATCTDGDHWTGSGEAVTLDDARDYAASDDAQAVRIHRDGQVVETVARPWTADEIADCAGGTR